MSADPIYSSSLSDKHITWLRSHAISDATAYELGLHSHSTHDAVMVPWRDATFPDSEVAWIHPDARKRFGVKSLSGEGENGLNFIRREGATRYFVVEGIGQHLAVASYLTDDWNVVGMNGCDGIHQGTNLSWARGAEVAVLWDADHRTNTRVGEAVKRVLSLLVSAGAVAPRVADLPADLVVGATDGVDDVLARMDIVQRTSFLARLLADSEIVTSKERVNVSNAAKAGEWLLGETGVKELAGVFSRGNTIVHTPRIGEDGYIPPLNALDEDGPAQVQPLTQQGFKARVENRYDVGRYRERKGSDGEVTKTWDPTLFPMGAAIHAYENALQGAAPNLRSLHGVTHTPVLRKDGSVFDAPGYDASTRLLYLPDPLLRIPSVPDSPTEVEIKSATDLILLPFSEFPFVEENHRANIIGALFTPIMRAMLPGPYPMVIIDAPSPGSGKGFLSNILRHVHGGVVRSEFPVDKAEFNKTITAVLVDTTAPIVVFDNVRGVVRSAGLEALLTTAMWSDRYLGASRIVNVPNDRLWVLTGNNATIGGDLARRCLWVTIDPGMPDPQTREFTLDLMPWILEHRGEILAALLTVARGWVLAGAPTADPGRSDDFAAWVGSMRGMLSWAGVPGSFGAQDASVRTESDEDSEWGDFLSSLYGTFGTRKFTVKEVIDKFHSNELDPVMLPGDLADKYGRNNDAGFRRTLGRWFKNRAGRYTNGMTVVFMPDSKHGSRINIKQYIKEPMSSMPVSSPNCGDTEDGGFGGCEGFFSAYAGKKKIVDLSSNSNTPGVVLAPGGLGNTPSNPQTPSPKCPVPGPPAEVQFDALFGPNDVSAPTCDECSSPLVLVDKSWFVCPVCHPVSARIVEES
jgi:hypothetical protein